MAAAEPPPTFDPLIIEDPQERSLRNYFSPIWLKWFVDLSVSLVGYNSTSNDQSVLANQIFGP